MQWHVAMLAALFLGWCGSSMTSPIDNDRALPLNVWNLQPLELQWDAETAPEPMHNSRLSAYYDASWPVDVKVTDISDISSNICQPKIRFVEYVHVFINLYCKIHKGMVCIIKHFISLTRF